jgi:hypothetical protein
MDAAGNPQPAGAVMFTKPPSVPPALGGLMQVSDGDLNDVTGNTQAGEDVVSNVSGKAIELVHNKIAQQSFVYLNNAAKAMKRAAEVWLGMARECYENLEGETKDVVGLSESNDRTAITLGAEVKAKSGAFTTLSLNSSFFVLTSIAPNARTQKEAVNQTLLNMLSVTSMTPELSQVIVATVLLNTEGSGLDDLKAFVRQQLLKAGAVKPTDEEKAAMEQAQQNMPPDANTQFLLAQTEKTMAEIEALKVKNENVLANTAKTAADTEKVKSDIMKTITELAQNQKKFQEAQLAAQLQMFEKLGDMISKNEPPPAVPQVLPMEVPMNPGNPL